MPKSAMPNSSIEIAEAGKIVESTGSRAARAAAGELGNVVGSSYSSTAEDMPVLWAFDIEANGRRLVLAGGDAQRTHRVLLITDDNHAFSAMLYGKALIASATESLVRHTVTQITSIPSAAGWYCDTFYLARTSVTGLRPRDVVAVALYADEAGLEADAAEAAVLARSPDWRSTIDNGADQPGYGAWFQLVRSLRRLARLHALTAPEIMVAADRDRCLRLWQQLPRAAWLPPTRPWPHDVAELARDLGFGTRPD